MTTNNAIIFQKPPTEFPVVGEHLAFTKRTYDLSEPKDGEVVTENIYLSIDPYLRGRMRNAEIKSYSPAFPIGQPIRNHGIVRIHKSANANYKVGSTYFIPNIEWAEYTLLTAPELKAATEIKNEVKIPLSQYLGAVGMPGMTAYSSFYEIGQPKKGETIFISAASGAVGQLVGQLAKREGLFVVGSAGTDDKVKHLLDIGFDKAFNYKTEKPGEALAKYCPKGIDIYFENVGGETLDAALAAANKFGRFIFCGMISGYNGQQYGVKNLMYVIGKSLTLRGFIVSDLWAKYHDEFYTNVPKWLASGEITYKSDIAEGLENGSDKFVGMLRGENFGKTIIQRFKMSKPVKYTQRADELNRMSLFSRRLRIFTWFTMAFVGGYMVFFNDYSGSFVDQDEATKKRGHVFSDVQRWVKERTASPSNKDQT